MMINIYRDYSCVHSAWFCSCSLVIVNYMLNMLIWFSSFIVHFKINIHFAINCSRIGSKTLLIISIDSGLLNANFFCLKHYFPNLCLNESVHLYDALLTTTANVNELQLRQDWACNQLFLLARSMQDFLIANDNFFLFER